RCCHPAGTARAVIEGRQMWAESGQSAGPCRVSQSGSKAILKRYSSYPPKSKGLLTLPPTGGIAGYVGYRHRGMSCGWTIWLAPVTVRWRGGGARPVDLVMHATAARPGHPREHHRLRRDRTGVRAAAPLT